MHALGRESHSCNDSRSQIVLTRRANSTPIHTHAPLRVSDHASCSGTVSARYQHRHGHLFGVRDGSPPGGKFDVSHASVPRSSRERRMQSTQHHTTRTHSRNTQAPFYSTIPVRPAHAPRANSTRAGTSSAYLPACLPVCLRMLGSTDQSMGEMD